MNQLIDLLTKLTPEMIPIMTERIQILEGIYSFQPIGRRVLAEELNLTERVLRTEIEVLKNQNLIHSTKKGMQLTQEGEALFKEINQLCQRQSERQEKEDRLKKLLNIEQCLIVEGNSDQEETTKKELGRRITKLLAERLPSGETTIGVTGGTTMATVAEQFTTELSSHRALVFVPARGSMKEGLAIQANAISETMAKQTNGKNQVLYVPETVSPQVLSLLMEEPEIRRTLELLYNADCVLFSISDAMRMAERRNTDSKTMTLLQKEQAVGEAFGEYFNKEGKTVYSIPQIGLQSRQLKQIPLVVAAAGGESKAEAIAAFAKKAPEQLVLVTDEGAADKILRNV